MIVPLLKKSIQSSFTNIPIKIKTIGPFIAYNVIIGPHGITDLIHAFEYKKIINLLVTYGICLTFSKFIQINKYENIMNNLFLLLSALHFRHDIPVKNNYLQFFLTLLFVLNLNTIGTNTFLIYMTFLHVPNHYLTYSKLIEKHNKLSYLCIFSISFILCTINYNNNFLFNYKMKHVFQGLIIGHIMYEEIFTNEKKRNFLIL